MGSALTSVNCDAHDVDIYNISEGEVSEWLFTSTETVMLTVVIPTLFSIGVVTNCTFIFVLFRARIKSNMATNVYLAHLALGDTLYLTLYAAFQIRKFMVTPVVTDLPIQSPVGLSCYWFVGNIGYFSSLALVTMVSVERYLALCHPIKHLKIRSRQRTYRLVAICWLVGLAYALQQIPRFSIIDVKCLQWPDDSYQGFPSKIAEYGSYDASSSIHLTNVHLWNYFIFIQPIQNIPWFIAMFGNIYMYFQMIRVLNKRRHQSDSTTNQKALKVRNQVAKMLIVNGIIFFICQTPYNVITFSGWICLLADVPNPVTEILGSAETIRFVVNIPIIINNVVNPLIYGAMSTQYREAFIKAFQFKGQRRKSSPSLRGTDSVRGSNVTTEISSVEVELTNSSQL